MQIISGFDEHYTQSEILSVIDGMSYPGGGTRTGNALLKAKSDLFDKSARPGIPNIAIIITDGVSNDDVGAPAQQLRDSGCTVFSVGVGNGYNMGQLREMATDPDAQHVLEAKFEDLDSIVKEIVGVTCTGTLIDCPGAVNHLRDCCVTLRTQKTPPKGEETKKKKQKHN